jgi:hypothetical protein
MCEILAKLDNLDKKNEETLLSVVEKELLVELTSRLKCLLRDE